MTTLELMCHSIGSAATGDGKTLTDVQPYVGLGEFDIHN
jgi:hypothetical protein